MPVGDPAYPPIRDYALIGDTHTCALVSRGGSIDWFCFPRFDSPAVLCRLLDAGKGGRFCIAPSGEFVASRTYVGPTCVLCTRFRTKRALFRLTDFMPVRLEGPDETGTRILRLIECLGGEDELEVQFQPTFDFARGEVQLAVRAGEATARSPAGEVLALRGPVPLERDTSGGLRGRSTVRAGARLWFALACGHEREAGRSPAGWSDEDCELSLRQTLGYWRRWASQCVCDGPNKKQVLRSALTLKLLTYAPTGALVAAPTTSLPEHLGGVRNWDYRYAWLRDSALILYALQSIGHREEARAFFHWIEGRCIECFGDLQIMYAVDGNPELPEELLPHLEGYAGSRPVRIGNAASTQRQLDIYGELLDAAHLYVERIGTAKPELPEVLWLMANRAARLWREPDESIWEVRSGRRQFLYSKLMCWVAVDRALRMKDVARQQGDVGLWTQAREELREAILTQGYDAKLGAFTQSFDEPVLDASALALPLVGFLPPTDPRVRSTVVRIQERLTRDGLVHRYLTPDGLPGDEGAFLLCTLWLVDNLALSGRVEEAQALYEHVSGFANDVGLLSEEIDPATGEFLGNFPQGFTHLGLIMSALHIEEAARFGPERRPMTFAERQEEPLHPATGAPPASEI